MFSHEQHHATTHTYTHTHTRARAQEETTNQKGKQPFPSAGTNVAFRQGRLTRHFLGGAKLEPQATPL